MKNKKMKVLIISHNPITTYHNMGKTLLSLFQNFFGDEICQLYCYPTIPDVKVCSSYYRITDIDVLKSFCPPFIVNGTKIDNRRISADNTMYENSDDRVHYQVTQEYKRILRDIMWKMSNWYNHDLRKWIEKEKPTCIFVTLGDAKFLYDIALKISKDYRIPIISYVCDDFYFTEKKGNYWTKIRYILLKRKIDEFYKKTEHSFYICQELYEIYSNYFGVKGDLLMTGAELKADKILKANNPRTITYMGNIRCHRYKALVDIGQVLDEINRERNTFYQLEIYTNEDDVNILNSFKNIGSIEVKGFLKGEDYYTRLMASEVLLHVEAFETESINLVKYSVSTKIPEILSSGIPLFAYGPNEVASIKHLIKNQCAITSVSREKLKEKIILVFTDEEEREKVVCNALKTVEKFHDTTKNSDKLKRICKEVSLCERCDGEKINT